MLARNFLKSIEKHDLPAAQFLKLSEFFWVRGFQPIKDICRIERTCAIVAFVILRTTPAGCSQVRSNRVLEILLFT